MTDPALHIVPSEVEIVQDDPRAAAVAMFRRLADALESGELMGARVQWREGQDFVETVELNYETKQVKFKRTQVEG